MNTGQGNNDKDNRWQGSTWEYPGGRRIYWQDKAIVKSGDNEGDFTIISGGVDGTAESSKTWTDRDVTGGVGSKIGIQMHSNDLRIGVHLSITNDVGQSDEIVIPAFLTTKR